MLLSHTSWDVPLREDAAAHGSTVPLIALSLPYWCLFCSSLEAGDTGWNKRPGAGMFLISHQNVFGKRSTPQMPPQGSPEFLSASGTYGLINIWERRRESICWPALAKTQTISFFLRWSNSASNPLFYYGGNARQPTIPTKSSYSELPSEAAILRIGVWDLPN